MTPTTRATTNRVAAQQPPGDIRPGQQVYDKRYDRTHRKRRAAFKQAVADGLVNCARCRNAILPGEQWDMGHIDGTNEYAGPEHVRCNRATRTPGRITAPRRRVHHWLTTDQP